MTSHRIVLYLVVVFAGAGLALASGLEKTPIHRPPRPRVGSDQPFSAFHRIDALLTKLDRDNQRLRVQFDGATKLPSPRQRDMALRKLRRSADLRDAVQASSRLVTISQHEEAQYAKRKQSYGRVLFRELHTRAAAMRGALVREANEQTVRGFAHQERKFNQRLLAFVLQFQAISGGYGALACDPGGWTCCQPRTVRADGKTEMKGCTWLCASKARACRGGCLGPKIPNVAAAIQPNKPRLPSTPARAASRPGVSE